MSQISDHGINDPDVKADEEHVLPCAEALLAGTLALMTGHAQTCCDQHRELMAQKAASNLLMLSQHPLLSPGFRSVAWRLRERWLCQSQSQADLAHGPGAPAPDRAPAPITQATRAANGDASAHATRLDPSCALWHTTSEVIQ